MHQQNPRVRPGALALAGLAFLPLACGRTGPEVHPVRGEVFVGGQAAVGASVTFHALNAKETRWVPTATVEADGSFRLTTVSAYDGAPPGDYAVTVTWSDSYREDGETLNGPERLEWRYANPATSGLKATIKPGNNQLPRFDLN
jgi:hypothetical protein